MQVRTGTVTVTNGSPIVTGTETTWGTGVQPGAMFLVRGDATPYYVASVVNNTQLTLSAPYQGATAGDQFYWITTSFTPNKSYPIPENGDVDPALILSRAIAEIDADIGAGGGGGASKLGQLTDVSVAGVATGDVLTRLAGGTYGFAPTAGTLMDGANLGTGAGLFAGKVGNSLTFKSLTVQGATLTPSATDLTLTVPAPGETNTASNTGSASAIAVFRQKTGVNFEFAGLRAGSGIALTQDGNDIVVTSTAPPTSTGEINTASNLGLGTVQLYKAKTGVNLGFRTITFDAAKFGTALSTDGNSYTISAIAQPMSSLSDVLLSGAAAGQFLRLDSDGKWKAAALPAAGLASVSADPAPSLGGNLALNGRTIVGLRGSYSGMIEKPKVKTYTLELNCPEPRAISTLTAACASGNVNFIVTTGDVLIDTGTGTAVDGLSGQAGSTPVTLTPTNSLVLPVGGTLKLKVSVVDNIAADFSFTISYQSV